MPTFDAGAISSELTLNSRPFLTAIGRAKAAADQFQSQIKNQFAGIQKSWNQHSDALKAAGSQFAIAGAAAAAGIGLAVKAAAKVQESENLFAVSLGKNADAVRAWSESVAESLGHPATQLREVVGNFDLMISTMGFAEGPALTMSKSLTKLAADLESLRNIPFDEAIQKLTSGLSGEVEPLRRLGVIVSETAVRQFAWTHGIVKTGEELTEQQKVLGRYGVMMEGLKTAQGDFAHTQDSFTNVMRTISNQVLDISQRLGGLLLPSLSKIGAILRNVNKASIDWIKTHEELATALVKVAAGTTAALIGFAGIAIIGPRIIAVFRGIAVAASIAWGAISAPIVISVAGIVAALAAVGVAVQILRREWNTDFDGMRTMLTDWGGDIKKIFGGLWSPVQKFLSRVMDEWPKVFGFMRDFAKETVNQILRGWSMLAEGSWELVKGGGIDAFLDKIEEINKRDYVAGFVPALKEAGEAIKKGLSIASDGIAEGANMAFEQTKGDVNALIDLLKAKFPEAAEQVEGLRKLLAGAGKAITGEAYTPFNVEELTKGMQASINASSKAGKALDQLKEKATSLRDAMLPAAALSSGMQELVKLAAKFPYIVTEAVRKANIRKLVKDMFDEMGTDSDAAVKQAIQSAAGISEAAKSQLVGIVDEMRATSAQSFYEGLLPGADVLKDLKDNLANLQTSATVHPDAYSLFAADLWTSLESLSDSALSGILKQIQLINPELAKALNIARAADTLQASQDRGKQIFDQMNPSEGLVQSFKDVTAYAEKLKELGKDSNFEGTVWAKEHWSEMAGASKSSIQKTIDELKKLGTQGEEAAKKIEDLELAKTFDGVASALSGIGGALGQLGPQFAKVGQAAQLAGSVMNMAADFAAGNWLNLAIDGIGAAAQAMGLFGDKTEEVKKGMDKVMEEIGAKWGEWADRLTDTLVEFVKTGKLNFKELVDGILEDILRLTIRWAVMEPIMNAVGITTASAKGNVFQYGNVVPFAKGGVVSGPTLFPMAKGMGLMGEDGPEAVMPLQRGSDGKLGVRAQGGGVNIQVIDQRTTPSAAPVEVQRMDDGTVKVFIRDAVRAMAANGEIDTAMQQNYGAKRQTLRR